MENGDFNVFGIWKSEKRRFLSIKSFLSNAPVDLNIAVYKGKIRIRIKQTIFKIQDVTKLEKISKQ